MSRRSARAGARALAAVGLALVVAAVASATFAPPSAAGAGDSWIGEPPACGDPTVASLSAVDCEPVEAVPSLDESTPQTAEQVAAFAAAADVVPELPAYCRLPADVIFYTATDWVRLAETIPA
jgi:hypothetical protein